ncbi:hypothetical protein KJS94_15720 [Flavihumibacter rivuli]|uniref:POTRA domain-containing protein n=1 Tax=Flavihumibacter rivuli TaxID=2838156 RepID=UPI001BDDD76C|nr:POTRA domain-containing protein [Flavihumibacter rivuli]ULQ56096.1 hypothetical protein KJS94_15720 [Flavihumibacter rivuli]
MRKYRILLVVAGCCLCSVLKAQNNFNPPNLQSLVSSAAAEGIAFPDSASVRKPFLVSRIFISGNRKTKEYIIKRELPFQEGDSVVLNELVEKFQVGRQQLINTRLFNDVVISLKSFRGYLVDVQVDVKERWYIFPIPYFKPVDRNLQAWADKGYSFDRVNYGAKFTYYNTTGRNDQLRLWLITGYSRQIQLSYEQPFADKSLKHGFGVSFVYSAQKEVNPLTIDNKQFFLRADSLPKAGKFLEERWGGTLQYSYRPGLQQTRHYVRLGYYVDKVDSAVIEVNPNYLNNGKTRVAYPELSYTVNHVNVDYAPYPLKGVMGDLTLSQRGIGNGVNMFSVSVRGTKAWDLGWKSSAALQFGGVLRLPFDQPFVHSRLFGYGDFYLRGLEKYVVDGVAGALLRNTIRRELTSFYIPFPIKSQSHDRIPFRIYAKAYGDMGYSHNKNFPDNSLVNKMLYTAGAGIDVVTFYDIVMRFEYGFNQLGESGFFFHFKNDF